jgi:hypothetical protein
MTILFSERAILRECVESASRAAASRARHSGESNSMELGRSFVRRRAAWVALLCGVLGSGTSCGLVTPAQSTEAAQLAKVEKLELRRLPSAALEAVGLEEVWYVPEGKPETRDARDGGVQSVHLLPEGLVIVTAPTAAGTGQLMKFIQRGDGNSLWWEQVDGPIDNAPFVYNYPTGGKSAELFYRIDDTIHCLDQRYGVLQWKKLVEPPIGSGISANETHVFFGGENGRFYSFRKNESFHDWQYATGGAINASAVLTSDRIVFGSLDGSVHGLTPDQGYVQFRSWELQTGGRVTADIVSHARWIFVGSEDFKLYCIEATDGSVFWSFGAEAPIRDRPVIYRYRPNEEWVFCLASATTLKDPRRTLFGIRLPKGEAIAPNATAEWRRENVLKVVSIGRDVVYVLDAAANDGDPRTISALDVRTGEEKFKLDIGGFDFVPTNLADAGRDANEIGRIYLIDREGAIQCLRESRR